MIATALEEGFTVPDGIEWPGSDTVVLLNRELVPEADPRKLSRFAEHRWHLSEAVFEEDAKSSSLNFAAIPAPLRLTAKYYIWHRINADSPESIFRTMNSRSSIQSILSGWAPLKDFMLWLHDHAVTSLDQVDDTHLDNFLIDLDDDESMSLERKYRRAAEVRRLWSYRALLPEQMRLPMMPPWGGDSTRELFGRTRSGRQNLTRRISEETMQPLLSWALRFIEDFADDILAAHAEYLFLNDRSPDRRRRLGTIERSPTGQVEARMAAWLKRLRASGGTLPGQRNEDGSISIRWRHVGKILHCQGNPSMAASPAGKMALTSGIAVREGCFLETPISATVGGRPWHDGPVEFDEARPLARLLSTACFIVLSYLSGARPGEVLNLRRGCVSYDPVTNLHLIRGVFFKNAVDANGNKIPAGKHRRDPWVVVAPVAAAVTVLERLHDHELLFPSRIEAHRRLRNTRRKGEARNAQLIAEDLAAFVDRCNNAAKFLGAEPIPADRSGPLNASRFRRTLAWFIRRRPRGLVAATIQYGHVHTRLLQGYAGDYDSGFPDDYAFEDFLARMEELAEDAKALAEGENVSGPAAGAYRERITGADRQFAGHVLKVPNTI